MTAEQGSFTSLRACVSDVRYSPPPINRHFVAQLVCRAAAAWPHPEVFGSIDTADATYSAARNSATARVYRRSNQT